MASQAAWNQGWAIGAGKAQEQHAHRQALSDEQYEDLRNEFNTNIGNLQAKYSSSLGPKGEETPESLKVRYALQQALLSRNTLGQNNPSVGQKVEQKVGEWLHVTPRPQVPTVTSEIGGVTIPAATSEPVTLAATLASTPVPTQPAATAATPATAQAGTSPTGLVPVAPGLRRVFPARPGFHLVSNPSERQRIYYQSDSDPARLIPATTGVGGRSGTATPIASAAEPAYRQYAVSAPPQAGAAQSAQGGVPDPRLSAVAQAFPRLAPYLSNVRVQQGTKAAGDDRGLEFYPPWESENPNPGKITLELFDKMQGPELTGALGGDLLHYIGSRDPKTGKPIDPQYWAMKQAVMKARTPQQDAMDRREYENAKKNEGEARSYQDWLEQSRIDAYIRGYVTPVLGGKYPDEWRKQGQYNSPVMKQAVEKIRQYVTTPDTKPKQVGVLRAQARANVGQETVQQSAQGAQPARVSPTGDAVSTPESSPTGEPTETAAESTTLPGLPTPAISVPRQKLTVRGPAQTPGQLRQQAQANQRAQQEAAMLEAAAPLTPQQEAVQAARAQAAGKIETIRAGLAAIKEFHPSAPPEELERLNNEYLDVGLGTKEKPGTESYKTQGLTLEDGSVVPAQYDSKSGRWFYLNNEPIPADVLRTAKIAAKPGTAKSAWSRDERGRIYSVNLDPATHQEVSGTRNYDLVPPASLTGRITTGQFHYVDENGQVHEVAETRTSTPMGSPGGAPAPSAAPSGTPRAAAPAGAGAAPPRRPVAPVAPRAVGGGAGRDKVIGWKGTKEYSDLRTQYHGAQLRMETMDKNIRHALNGDQQAMLSLVAQHIGMTLGAQKGARINQAVWNEAVASAPWLQTVYAKAFHNDPETGDMVFDGWKGGVTLTPDQMRSMVDLAHEQVDTLKDSLDRLTKEQQPGGSAAPAAGSVPPGWK